MTNKIISKKTRSQKILPYVSLFTLLFAIYFVFSVIKDLNPIFIPYKINKFLNIFFSVTAVIIELTGLRDYVWNLWKKIPITIHLVVSFFFSLIILNLIPIAVQKVWNKDYER